MAKLVVYVKILDYEFLDDETLEDFSPTQESTRDKGGEAPGRQEKNTALLSRESFKREDFTLQNCAIRAWTTMFF